MKTTAIILFLLSIVFTGLDSCGNKSNSAEQTKSGYTCPMDTAYHSDKPGVCPKCGMTLVPDSTLSVSAKTFKMKFSTSPAMITSGEQVTISLTPTTLEDSSAIIPLDIVHEKKIHLIVVSKDLSWFEHIHPEQTADGSYRVSTSFPFGGEFILFADYTPTGAEHQLQRIPVTVNGSTVVAKTFTEQDLDWKGDDGYEVQMSFGGMPVKAGAELMPTITITKDGKNVTDLDNYLGALGHMVIISSDSKNYLHVHPMEDGTHGPSIMFHTQFDSKGIYRAFLQFNHGGKIHTADFVIDVNS
ncbi:MAG TPA: heavy metal-binding domain-containing protein [Bacteroidia bacterium]|jgi:hypothetical protein|nr:heavy metal-binding domain-containing protein [Bacteroidia bacterium]